MKDVAQYGYDNAEPTYTHQVYVDTCGGRYDGLRPEDTALATNAIILLVGDFIHKRGIFCAKDGWGVSEKSLYEAISEIMVDLDRTE